MKKSPYIREGLWASKAQATDPQAELETWLFECRQLLKNIMSATEREPLCFSLIATYGRFQRIRPELLNEQETRQLVDELAQRLNRQGADWIKGALKVPNPPAWLNDVDMLEESSDALAPPLAHVEAACNLVEDLDDVDLVYWFARNIGVRDQRLERELEECHFRLAVQPDTFLPASVYVQAVGELLRPDLAEFDPELAVTAQKFIVLLDAFVAAEQSVTLADQPRLPPGVLKHLHGIRTTRRDTIRLSDFQTDWPLDDTPIPGPDDTPVLAAADDSDAETVRHQHAAPAFRYAEMPRLGGGKLILVSDGHTITLLCYMDSDRPPPAMYLVEPDRAKQQVDWKPSPVHDRLYRSVLGPAHGTHVIETPGDPRKTITIVE